MRLSTNQLRATLACTVLSAAAIALMAPTKCIRPLQIMSSAEPAIVTLDDTMTEHQRYGETWYTVSYTFRANEKTWKGTSDTSWKPVSEETKVWYLPSDPTVNGLQLNSEATQDLLLFLIPVAALGLCLLALVMDFRDPSPRDPPPVDSEP